jgi:amino acid adenylation domain-containing protein
MRPGDDLVARVERFAQITPSQPALVEGGRAISYASLDRVAAGLARHLAALGLGPEVLAAICLERGAAMVAAQLAVWKTRGAFLPIDPSWPKARISRALRENRAAVLITDRDLDEATAVTMVRFHGEWDEAPPEKRAPWAPQQLAYLICTSGSTGEPKGVEIEQGSLAHLLSWHVHEFAVTPSDRATIVSPPGFDASIWEIWPYLAAGATLYVADEITRASPFSLRQWMAENGMTLAFLPTPWVELLLSRESPEPATPSLRALLTGGARLQRFARPLPFRLINNYGPTEATVVTTSGALLPGDEVPHIGSPLPYARVYVLDEDGRPAPEGQAGELYIAGPGVARGYRGQPEQTAQRFLPDRFAGHGLMYRSGDRVRRRPDGSFDFLGRLDDQIKIRGFRIEPAEVEVTLLEHAAVREAAVIAHHPPAGEPLLVAYIVCAPDTPEDSLTAFLAARLPSYMIPSSFIRLAQLPRTPHGKIDRRALADPPR